MMDSPAPLATSLLRTTTVAGVGQANDALAALESAGAWLTAAGLDAAPAVSGVRLRRADLEPLRALRERLRKALRADRSAEEKLEFGGVVELRWGGPGCTSAKPLGSGWEAIAALVTVELVVADAADTLRRVKTCANPECGYPFVDRSRNLSRMWHDTDTCGNVINLRASRARRATAV